LRGFDATRAYGTSKLANVLFAKELHARYFSRGLSAVAFHPGNVATNFASDTSSSFRWVYQTALHRFLVPPERAGHTLAYFIEGRPGRDWRSGEFYGSRRRISRTHRQAYDAVLARRLWDRSASLVGLG
jgi:NAD(P)-dependent dehydrogenase (short-subunit alcohol dehydrogenase family)